MARVNVYLPDELASAAREAGLNVSGLTQEAIRRALVRTAFDHWLDDLDRVATPEVSAESAAAALVAARADFGRPADGG